jgi:VWFA-related protein
VSVTDDEGRSVRGLSRDDFDVIEDGDRQDVSLFAAHSIPLDLALLVATPAQAAGAPEAVRDAASRLIRRTHPGDRVAVIDIGETPRVLRPLGDDLAAADHAIAGTTAGGSPAVYDGIYRALKDLSRHPEVNGEARRQVMIVLSDGNDTTSLVTFDDVMALAKRMRVAVYSITLRAPVAVTMHTRAPVRDRATLAASALALKALAEETSARALFPATASELAGACETIADDLASQYLLGYAPSRPGGDGSYRTITVRVDRPGLRARARPGYVASMSGR